jgi:hypothetical protein
LPLAGGRLNEIYIWLAANQMINTEQLAANWMQILQKYAASVRIAMPLVFASKLGLHFYNL